MFEDREIPLPVTDQHCPVEFRIAADIVIIAGIERLPCAVDPGLLGPEGAIDENRPRVAGRWTVHELLAALQDRDPGAPARPPASQGTTPDPRSAVHAAAH